MRPLLLIGLIGICSATAGSGQDLNRYEWTHLQMGTTFKISLYATDSLQADSAVRSAFARIDELNAILSDYREESEVSRLSATAGTDTWVGVGPDLWQVLSAGQQIAELTSGAFDLTIGPLSKLWRRAFRRHQFPAAKAIEAAKASVGYQLLQLDDKQQRAQLKNAGMRLDLGGIAKGYTAGEALKVLSQSGFDMALVDAGGDIVAGSPPPGRDGWKIAYPSHDRTGEEKNCYLQLANAAIATSGADYRYLEWEGRRYSHIIDPRTGLGLLHNRLVTVVADDGMQADALASAFSVMEQPAILSYKRRTGFLPLKATRAKGKEYHFYNLIVK